MTSCLQPMKSAIVVATHRSGIRWLENLLASFAGYNKYPLLIVINEFRKEDRGAYAPLLERFGNLPITIKTIATNSFEFGGLYVAYRETAFDEFLLLPHSCEIVDPAIFDLVFEKYRGRSVAFGLQTGNWKKFGLGRKRENEHTILRYLNAETSKTLECMGDVQFWQGHIGKYRRTVLDRMDLDEYLPKNIIEAISQSELLFTNRYHALDRGTVVPFPQWVDGEAIEHKFGKKALKVANRYLIKWKSHWNVAMVLDDVKLNELAARPADFPSIVTLTRFPDIFARLRESVERHEYHGEKIVVTSGSARVNLPGWRVIEGVEPFVFGATQTSASGPSVPRGTSC